MIVVAGGEAQPTRCGNRSCKMTNKKESKASRRAARPAGYARAESSCYPGLGAKRVCGANEMRRSVSTGLPRLSTSWIVQ